MKVLIVLAALAVAASAVRIPDAEVKSQFETFKKAHGKVYADEAEELYRSKIFKENLIRVNKHNERHQKGEVSFSVAINKFSDMHTHEVVAARNGFRAEMKTPSDKVYKAPTGIRASKSAVDWRDEGLVGVVKDQGSCGSCWSFSATGALEGALAKKTGKLVSLSEQNLVDCTKSWKYQNAGCNGGLMDAAFQYVKDNNGIDSEESYPYKGRNGWWCHYKSKNKAGSATGFVDVNATEEDLESALETVGPISIAIDASQWSFNHYSDGIYEDSNCGNGRYDLDHGVLAVGYGEDYWIVKNSWGESWGQNGYIKMAKGKNNACGVATMASYPTV